MYVSNLCISKEVFRQKQLDVWKMWKVPPALTLPQTRWGMKADSEIVSTILPEDKIPLLGSFAQKKLWQERKKDGIGTPIQMR